MDFFFDKREIEAKSQERKRIIKQSANELMEIGQILPNGKNLVPECVCIRSHHQKKNSLDL